MSEKVALPREVAEAIEELRKDGYTDWEIMHQAQGAVVTSSKLVLKRWAFDLTGEGTPDLLMRALVNGYEIQRTPHEELREYYLHCRNQYARAEVTDDMPRITEYLAKLTAIKNTLRILGITVEGINDTNASTDAT